MLASNAAFEALSVALLSCPQACLGLATEDARAPVAVVAIEARIDREYLVGCR